MPRQQNRPDWTAKVRIECEKDGRFMWAQEYEVQQVIGRGQAVRQAAAARVVEDAEEICDRGRLSAKVWFPRDGESEANTGRIPDAEISR